MKTTEECEHSLKARIFPHGNKDKMKEEVRNDSTTAQFDAIRMLLAMATFLPVRMGVIDKRGACMKSGPINREIYVRSPREWHGRKRGNVWKLIKIPYGVTEAGPQWATVI